MNERYGREEIAALIEIVKAGNGRPEDRATKCWRCHAYPRAMVEHPFGGEEYLGVYCVECSSVPRIAKSWGAIS